MGRQQGCGFQASIVVATLLLPLAGGCDLLGLSNPTPGAVAARFGKVWVRHLKDKHDREATILVGFTLADSKGYPVAADGELSVELKWRIGATEWIASGEGDVAARSFRKAEGKPVRDGAWYVEPWSIYTIGSRYPGPAQHGYDASLKFKTAEGETLTFGRYLNITR